MVKSACVMLFLFIHAFKLHLFCIHGNDDVFRAAFLCERLKPCGYILSAAFAICASVAGVIHLPNALASISGRYPISL